MFVFVCFYSLHSRPKQVKDVAHQDEVVRVLTNTLETANVCIFFSNSCWFKLLIFQTRVYDNCLDFYLFMYFWLSAHCYICTVPAHAVLWPSWHWQNNNCSCHCSSAFRVLSTSLCNVYISVCVHVCILWLCKFIY